MKLFVTIIAVLMCFSAAQAAPFDAALKAHTLVKTEIAKMQNTLHSVVESFVANHHSRFNLATFKPELQLTTACSQAFDNFLGKWSNCSTLFAQVTSSGNSNDATAYCAANGCRDQLRSAMQQFATSCASELSDPVLGNFTRSAKLVELPCLQDSAGHFCWASFYQSLTQAGSIFNSRDNNFTTAGLDGFCTQCTLLVIQNMRLLMGNDTDSSISLAKLVSIACIKYNGEYCLVYLNSLPEPKSTEEMINSIINYYCVNQCASLTLNAMAQFNPQEMAQTSNMINQLCAKDGGNYCVRKFSTLSAPEGTCPDIPFMANTTCNASCKASFDTVTAQSGCCTKTLFAILESSNDMSPGTVSNFFKTQCGKTIPFLCLPSSGVSGKFAIKNLKYSYYTAHQSDVNTRLASDIATAGGIDSSRVNITGAESYDGGNGVIFSITISVTTSNQAQSMQQILNSQLATPGGLPSLSGLPVSAYANASASLGFDSGSSTISTTSSAVSWLQSSWLLLTLLIAATLKQLF